MILYVDTVGVTIARRKTSVNLPHIYSQQKVVVILKKLLSHDQTFLALATPYYPYCKQLSGGWGRRDEAMGYGKFNYVFIKR